VKRGLLDINVLIALFDELHQHHQLATDWLKENINYGWASCPITQNGFIRIITQPRYIRPVTMADSLDRLSDAAATKHHEFWPDDISILHAKNIHHSRMHGPKQLTDIYLLALAVHHHGRFITFDDAIPLSAVPGATKEHLVVL
jgi:uncharacterized protein